jgi:TP901 family phage tail tape measure protein
MSEAIKRSDIQEGDIFGELAKKIAKARKELTEYNEELKDTAKIYQSELSKAEKINITNLGKLNALNNESSKLVTEKRTNVKNLTEVEKEQLRLEKAIAKEKAAVSLATSKENKELLKLRAEKNKANKAIRDEIKANERSKDAYAKLSDETNKAQANFKRLAAQYGVNSRQAKAARKEFDVLDNKLRKVNNAARDGRRDVGRYGTALNGLKNTLGALGLVAGVSTIVRNVSGVVANFDQAQTDLAAITGKTSQELSGLTAQARELGETTQFSATEITQLQIELAKLGFTAQEITDSTGGIANFAAATGVEIPRAAALAGSALRAFNLDATEIDRVVSTLGVATTKTALDFSQLETGLSTIAPVAASFGFSIEDTTALLGQLSNAGFDASSSATATRNILLNLADANGSLAKELGRPIKSADDLAAGLQELQAKGIDLASALELTDKRSVAAFSTFIENSDTLVPLRDSITDVNDELTDMAEKRLDSVQGALKLLGSAFESQVLGINEATGASEKFKNSIKFVAENLGTIFSILGKVIKAFVAFKVAMMALRLRERVIEWRDYNKSLSKADKGLKQGAKSAKAFGRAMKSIGFAAIISVVLELAQAWFRVASGAEQAERWSRRYGKAQEKGTENAQANIDRINKNLKEQIDLLRERQAAGEISEAQFLEESKALNEAKKEELKRSIEIVAARKREALAAKETAKANRQAFFDQLGGESAARSLAGTSPLNSSAKITADRLKALDDEFNKQSAIVGGTTAKLELYRGELNSTRDIVTDLSIDIKASETAMNLSGEAADKAAKQTRNLVDAMSEFDDILKSIDDKLASDLEDEFSQENDLIQKRLTERLTLITDAERLGTIQAEEAAEQRTIAELDALLERKKLLIAYGKDVTDIELEIAQKRLELSKEGNAEIVDNTEETQNELFDIVNSVQRNITKTIEDQVDRRIAALQRELDAQRTLRDQLTALAAEGNIDAQQSIKATIEAEREKEAEIARLEERKQKVQLISQGLETYLSLLENGESPGTAFAQTVITTQGLISFLSGLSGFWTGTENAPEGLAWTQEKGAEIITDKHGNIKSLGSDKGAQLTYLQRGDKVKNATETANIFKAFDELENVRTMPKIDMNGNSYDLLTLGSKLDRIEQAIKSQPQSVTNWEEITRGLSAINSTTRRGGDVVHNRHYIRK